MCGGAGINILGPVAIEVDVWPAFGKTPFSPRSEGGRGVSVGVPRTDPSLIVGFKFIFFLKVYVNKKLCRYE